MSSTALASVGDAEQDLDGPGDDGVHHAVVVVGGEGGAEDDPEDADGQDVVDAGRGDQQRRDAVVNLEKFRCRGTGPALL